MKQSVFAALILLAVCIPSGSCKKKFLDYRNKYLGDYRFEYHYTYWEMGGSTKDTTIHYDGEITYGAKGNLRVDWEDGSTREFSVSKKDGRISACNKIIGTASKTQIQLSFDDNLCGTGPLGSNYTVTLNGTKK